MTRIDYIDLANAAKIVPTAKYSRSKYIKTNIDGTIYVMAEAHVQKVTSVVELSKWISSTYAERNS